MAILGMLMTSVVITAVDEVAGGKVKKAISSVFKDLSQDEKEELEQMKKVYLKSGTSEDYSFTDVNDSFENGDYDLKEDLSNSSEYDII